MFPADGLHVPTPSYPSEILGTITEIGDRLLVEQEPGATIGNKTYLSLSDETQIFQRINSELQARTPDLLAVGQLVEVWVAGSVAESFPSQAEASVIVIQDLDEESTAEASTVMPPVRDVREPDVSGTITQASNTVWIDQKLGLFITPTTQFFWRSGNMVEMIDARGIKEGQRADVWVDTMPQAPQALANALVIIVIDNKLNGTRWILQSLNGHTLRANTAITLEFQAETVDGIGGCNRYGAPYTLQPENGFNVIVPGWTEKLCSEPEGVMEQESEYGSVFSSVTRYRLEGTTLSLANEQNGISLQYQLLPRFDVNPQDLKGKTWQLVSATGLDTRQFNVFTLQFDGNKYRASTICGGYTGTYQAINDDLRFPDMSMPTDVGCTKEDQIAAGEYTTLLSSVWQYNVSNTQLELYTEYGKKLVFERVGRTFPAPPAGMQPARPTYVNVSDCTPAAQQVIESQGFRKDQIHSCKEEAVSLDTGQNVNLVTIQYGGRDCGVDCFYESYREAISNDQTLIPLPSASITIAKLERPPFNEWQTWQTENWSIESHEELVERNGHYGWALKFDNYKFTRLYPNSYGNDASMRKTVYTITGEIFVYLDPNGQEVWDDSRLEVATEKVQ